MTGEDLKDWIGRSLADLALVINDGRVGLDLEKYNKVVISDADVEKAFPPTLKGLAAIVRSRLLPETEEGLDLLVETS